MACVLVMERIKMEKYYLSLNLNYMSKAPGTLVNCNDALFIGSNDSKGMTINSSRIISLYRAFVTVKHK